MSVSHAAIHKNMIILAIISFILTLLPVTGYGDDWVKVEENDAFSEYYNKSKIDINRAKKQFTVLQKMKWTEKGRNNLKSAFIFFGITPELCDKIDYSLSIIKYYYSDTKNETIARQFYSKSGETLFGGKNKNPELKKFDPQKDQLFMAIMRDYNLGKVDKTSSSEQNQETEGNGFRGIKWGAKLSDLSGDNFIFYAKGKRNSDLMLYRKQNDIMKINNIKVNDIIYIFYKQEFCAIRVIINGNSNSRKMLNFLTKKHGNAGKLSNNGYGWQGKIAYMVYQLVPKGGILHIFDKAVIKIIVKENEEYGWQIEYHN